MTPAARQPSLFIPHGGGPCFFMPDPAGVWRGMGDFLSSIAAQLPEAPRAVLVISGHWETLGFAVSAQASPQLIFDYYGFPPETYQLTYPAPGDPALAARVADLLGAAGLAAQLDQERGFDHGVFVPLKMMFPDADVPVVALSLDASLDPALHLAAGRALAPLRDQGVLIIASGMSFHNMRGYGDPRFTALSRQFDDWLSETVALDAPARAARLIDWAQAPAARQCHPREEHLLPLMVAAGASQNRGARLYHELVLETAISGYRFD